MNKYSPSQPQRVMQLSSIYLLALLTLSICSVANNSYAQKLLEKRLTIAVQDASIQDVLSEIEKLTNVKFFYSVDQLKDEAPVTLTVLNEKLGTVLNQFLVPRKIRYAIHDQEGTITLRKESHRNEPNGRGSTMATIDHSPHKVTGTVTDNAGQRMAGVNILVKGTSRGTSTTADGSYTIEVHNDDVLIFSFIGYAPMELLVGNQIVIDVTLLEDVRSLDEVTINAGYYKLTREKQTGSIVKISSKEIENNPVSNPLAALQGRVPGLEITQQTGIPGGNYKVRIRGTNSIASGNDPLYIIDGVPFISTPLTFTESSGELMVNGASPLNVIDPANIESIEVLKDADATAIYGSRGANGVILVTTKKGESGDLKVVLDYYQGIGKLTKRLEMLNTQQYLEMRHEAFSNDGLTATPSNAPDLLVWDTTRYTDWQDVLLGGTATITDAQVRLSGGNYTTNFSVSGGFRNETSVFPGSNYDRRGSLNFNLAAKSKNEKLRVDFSGAYSANSTNFQDRDFTRIALRLPPNAPNLFNEFGELNWENSTWENPLGNLRRRYKSNIDYVSGTTLISYDLWPGFTIKTSLGYTNTTMNAITTNPISANDPAYAAYYQNFATFSERSYKTWIVEPQINYGLKLAGGDVDFFLGGALHAQQLDGIDQLALGFVSESLMQNISAASTVIPLNASYGQYRYSAAFGRLNYNLQNKYIINLTARRDGSSRFGPDKQFANFGAIGAAWIFSNEGFVKKNLAFLSFGKIRSSYGITGNDQLGDYNYLDTYSTTGAYQGIVGLAPTRLSNPDFAWETNYKFEAAIELGFLSDRILFGFNYYNNRSSNQLIGYSLPPTTGFTSIQGNFPAMLRNTGVELSLESKNVVKNDVTWTTSINLSIPRNKLVAFPNLEQSSQYANTLVVGQPLSIRKLFYFSRVNPETGIYEYADLNGDGILSIDDRQALRNVAQDFYGGIHNTLRFKNFELDILFQGVKQTGYNPIVTDWAYPGSAVNQPVHVLKRWQQEGDIVSVQKYTSSTSPTATAHSRLSSSNSAIHDCSFIRLKNVSIAYTFSSALTNRLNIEDTQVFIRGQNILTFSNYCGLDPETQFIQLPPIAMIVVGVHVSL